MSDRRWLNWALLGLALMGCGWCSLLSGIGGWVIGSDVAERETRARLGATATADAALPPLGLLVMRTARETPASRGGLLRGDIIIAANGQPIADARDLSDVLRASRPGDVVRLTVDRALSQVTFDIALAPFPDDPQRAYLGIYYTARAEEPADL